MAVPMEELSADVFACITPYLTMHDLCALARVSKGYHATVQPLLWTVIEMHCTDFHVKSTHDALRVEECTERKTPPYNTSLVSEEPLDDEDPPDSLIRGGLFVSIFSDNQTPGVGLPEEKKRKLGALVQWLCLPIPFDLKKSSDSSPLVQAFAHFVNLEHLEISGFGEWGWSRVAMHMDTSTTPPPGLRKLKALKLRGYIPGGFVRWLLSEPEGIEELQMAILDDPIYARSRDLQGDESPGDVADWGWRDGTREEWFAPRARVTLTPEIISRLVSLKRLYLCKPSNGLESDISLEQDGNLFSFSEPGDEEILQEWSALLKATRKTLQHLTLDQRPVADEHMPEEYTNKRYMLACANGPSYDRFVQTVLPVLLDSKACPNLKVIRLFGFEPHDEGINTRIRHMEYPDCSVDVPGQLRAAFPDAEIPDYAGRRLIICNDTGELQPGEDVLESRYSFDDGEFYDVDVNEDDEDSEDGEDSGGDDELADGDLDDDDE